MHITAQKFCIPTIENGASMRMAIDLLMTDNPTDAIPLIARRIGKLAFITIPEKFGLHSFTFRKMGIKSSKQKSSKKVVVIGGSYAGTAAVTLLDPHFEVTWIERRPCQIHKMNVRAAVQHEWIDSALIPSDKVLSRGTRIQGDVTSVDLGLKSVSVNTTDGSKNVSYDYLIIATGSRSFSPLDPKFDKLGNSTIDSLKKHFDSVSKSIAGAPNIVVLGGGPVGCEMAGEIKAKYPTHNVTIISKSKNLCDQMGAGDTGSEKIKSAMEKCGIRVMLDTSVTVPSSIRSETFIDPSTVSLPNDLAADLIINCTGTEPNTHFMASQFLSKSKHIKVNEFLQVDGRPVFAIGDCNDVAEPKLFVTCGTRKFMFTFPTGHADIVFKNIVAMENGKTLVPYKPQEGKPKILLPLGPKTAVAINAPQFFAKMKAKDYFYPAQFKFSKNKTVPKLPL